MSSEKNAKDLLTFFSYLCLDDKVAVDLSSRCFFKIKQDTSLNVISASWQEVCKLKKIHKYTLPQRSHWNGSVPDIVRKQWIKFYDRSTFDEMTAYLWIFVLEKQIAEFAVAMDLSEGIVLSRLSRATQKMSEVLAANAFEAGEV